MTTSELSVFDQKLLWSRFWRSAAEFWRGPSRWAAWLLTCSLVAIVAAGLIVQYRLNYWNRDFFNALEQKDGFALEFEALLFLPLAAAGVAIASLSVWTRMTAQRKWREALTRHVIRYWLESERYRRLATVPGEHKNPEYRIAQDARIATEAPIDFAVGLLTALLTAVAFLQILWSVGGGFDLGGLGIPVRLPAYLVFAVVVYSALVTLLMLLTGSRLTPVIQKKNQSEAELIAAANLLREAGEGVTVAGEESQERRRLWLALQVNLARWRDLCVQLLRMTVVSHGNFVAAPIVGLMLCTPKYLDGSMTLGELTQVAAAFTTVQGSFNWLVDNYPRVADWRSSVNRVATLLLAMDELAHNGDGVAVGKDETPAAGSNHLVQGDTSSRR